MIPFELNEVHHGFSEAEGIMYLEPGFLVFEFTVSILGLFKRRPETVKVALSVIEDLRLERRFRKDRLFLRPRRSQVFEAIPGNHEGEILFKIRRKHRSATDALIAEVRTRKILMEPMS
jgi:hypothetical protein